MHRGAAAVLAIVLIACGNKKSEPSAGSGSAAGSGGQTVAQAMTIVCGSVDRAKKDPLWAQNEPPPGATPLDVSKLTGRQADIIDDILDREITNPEVNAVLKDDGSRPKLTMWSELMAKANLSSCAYVDRLLEVKKRLEAANAEADARAGSGSAGSAGSAGSGAGSAGSAGSATR